MKRAFSSFLHLVLIGVALAALVISSVAWLWESIPKWFSRSRRASADYQPALLTAESAGQPEELSAFPAD